MIHVIATVEVVPGKRAEFIDHFKRLVPEVHAEPGCIEYGPTVDVVADIAPQRADVVTVVEKWENLQALKVHLDAPPLKAFRAKAGQLIAKISIQVLEPA